MKKFLITLLAASAIGVGVYAATNTNANNRPAGPGAHHPRMRAMAGIAANKLGLTDEQRTSIKQVVQMHRADLQPLLAQARTQRQELRTIVTAPTLDDAALSAQSEKIAATQKQILIETAHLRADVRKLLTPEQIAKADAWRQNAPSRPGAMRQMFLRRFAQRDRGAIPN